MDYNSLVFNYCLRGIISRGRLGLRKSTVCIYMLCYAMLFCVYLFAVWLCIFWKIERSPWMNFQIDWIFYQLIENIINIRIVFAWIFKVGIVFTFKSSISCEEKPNSWADYYSPRISSHIYELKLMCINMPKCLYNNIIPVYARYWWVCVCVTLIYLFNIINFPVVEQPISGQARPHTFTNHGHVSFKLLEPHGVLSN